MYDNTQDNQRFIDAARERGEDTLMYLDPKSGEGFLVSGSPAGIRLLGEIIDDYELISEVVENIAIEVSRIHVDRTGDNKHAC
ncbi:hypothetical protein JKG47_02915 [Acidithiobacillus sp. MC6.1]|nr:hypothetical protein [Acidithiobacillus sp. MC6.1]